MRVFPVLYNLNFLSTFSISSVKPLLAFRESWVRVLYKEEYFSAVAKSLNKPFSML